MVRRILCFVLAAFAAGIYLRYLTSCNHMAGCFLCVLFPAVLWLLMDGAVKENRRAFGVSMVAAVVGFLLMQAAMWQADADPFVQKEGQVVTVSGVVVSSEQVGDRKEGAPDSGIRMTVLTEQGERVQVTYKGIMSEKVLDGRYLTGRGTVRLPQPARNPGCYDESLFLRSKRIYSKIQLKTAFAGPVVSRWRYFFARRRRSFQEAVAPYLSQENEALLTAMLFGDKSGLSEEQYESFQRNGTAHVLAVSGLHVGMVYALYRWLFGKRRSVPGQLVFAVLLFSYAALAGFSASVVRAAVMIGIHMAGSLLHTRYDMLTGTCLAAALILSVSPYQLFTAGFQLSFAAVLLLAFLLPACGQRLQPALLAALRNRGVSYRLMPVLNILLRWLLPLFLMQAGMVPLTAYLFQYVNPGSFAANLPLLFIAGLIVPGGIVLLVLLCLPAGGIFLPLGGRVMANLLSLLSAWNQLSYRDGALAFDVVSPPRLVLFLFYGMLLFFLSEHTTVLLIRCRFVQLAVLTCLCVLTAVLSATALSDGFFRADIVFVDVGQGNCVHLRGEDHVDVLIDGGGREDYDVGNRILRPYLLKNGVRTVDLAIVSHLDTDHFGGIESLCRRGMVRKLIVYEGHAQEVQQIAKRTGMDPADIAFAGPGDVFCAGGIQFTVLGPLRGSDSENEQSLVVLAGMQGHTVLLTGDIGASTEKELADAYPAGTFSCDILQVPHHGSRYSSSAALLDATAPSLAVIQVGINQYGHPAEETLARYQDAGVGVLRNDHAGAIGIDLSRMRIMVMIHQEGQAGPSAAAVE